MKLISKKVILDWYKEEYSGTNIKSVYGSPVKSLKNFFEIIGKHGNGKKVLELGCGDGRNLFALAKLGYAVTGIDLYGKASAEFIAKKLGITIAFIEKDLTKIKFENKKYYAVICSEVFHLMNRKDVDKTIERMKLATSENGFVYISILSNLKRRFIESREEFQYAGQSNYSEKEAMNLFAKKFRKWKILRTGKFHDEQCWPLKKGKYPLEPYRWSGDYVYLIAKQLPLRG